MSPSLCRGLNTSWCVPAMFNSPPLTCLVSRSFRLLAVLRGVRLSGKSVYYIYFNWPHFAKRSGISVREENSFDYTALVYCMHSSLCIPCLLRWQMLLQEAETRLSKVSVSTLTAPGWPLCTVSFTRKLCPTFQSSNFQ